MLLSKEVKESFFSFISKRQRIWYNRFILNKPREEWTDDPILKKYKFCNVFRELDRGTQILMKNVLKNKSLSIEEKFLNIAAYRFFNQRWFFDEFGILKDFDKDKFRIKMEAAKKKYGSCFSSAYLIGPNVLDPAHKGKIAQVSWALDYAWKHLDEVFYPALKEKDPHILIKIPQKVLLIGEFLSYQILLDLIYTGEMAVDDNCPLYVGPGAITGIQYAAKLEKRPTMRKCIPYIQELYESQSDYVDLWKDIYPPKDLIYAPNKDKYEISWSNIQFSQCEFRKFFRLNTELYDKSIRCKHRIFNPEYSLEMRA